jgi:hypothetical protein
MRDEGERMKDEGNAEQSSLHPSSFVSAKKTGHLLTPSGRQSDGASQRLPKEN